MNKIINYQKISNVLFYSILLFLPTQFGKHFWPDFSYVLGARVDYLSPTLYLTDILIISLAAFSLFSRLKFNRKLNFKFQISNFKYQMGKKLLDIGHLKLVLLVLFLLVGILLSKSPFAGLYGLLKLLEFGFFGYYMSRKINNKEEIFKVSLIFAMSVLTESFLSIFQYINQSSIGNLFYFLGERTFNSQTIGIANATINGELILRPYGTFPHPNVLAAFLLIGMTTAISNFKFLASRRSGQISNFQKMIFVSSLGFGTVALFLTLSRIAILLWVVTFVFITFGNLKIILKKNKLSIFPKIWPGIYYFLFGIITLSILGLFLFSNIRYRFLDLNLKDESVTVRTELIKSSINMVERSPIFGVGLNNFLVNLSNVQGLKTQIIFTYLQPVHNIYLLVLSETGVVGFGVFGWFIFKTLKGIRNKELGIRRKESIIHNSKFVILLSVLILGLFDHYFLTLQQGQLLFSFVLGFCWTRIKN